MEKIITFDDNNIKFNNAIELSVKNKEELISNISAAIMEEYLSHDCELHDLLDSIHVSDISISDAVRIYANLYNTIEGDNTFRFFAEGGYLDLSTNKQYI